MGELICGYNKDLITAAEIALFISASINTANCFDKNLSIKNKDVLEITPYIIRLNIYTITGFLKASELKLKKLMPSKLRMITTGYRKGITKPKLSSMVKNL